MTISPPKANSPAVDRRRAPRFPFVASAEITEINSGARMFARVTELSLYGCYVDMTQPFPSGTRLFVKIFTRTDYFEAEATVVYTQPNLGIGLAFRDVSQLYLPVLKKWLHGTMQEMIKAER